MKSLFSNYFALKEARGFYVGPPPPHGYTLDY